MAIIFEKSYGRDTTFSLQEFFVECLLGKGHVSVGGGNPHTPLYIHHFDGTSIQMYENKEGMDWFYDDLSKKISASPNLMQDIINDQYKLLPFLKEYWSNPSLTDAELAEYLPLARRAMENLTLYYLGIDEGSPAAVKQMATELRKVDELGADHDGFVRRIVESRGYPAAYANVLHADELSAMPARDVMDKRMRGAIMIDGKEIFAGTLDEYTSQHPEYEFEGLGQTHTNVTEVHGQVAQKGLVSGKVRIVKNIEQANALLEREIIVSPMTTPNFIAAMHKAGAFVTDEGGIMCHAAIVAREMKKPCVIGTKIATQIFRDGDMVEVDAEKGTVRKI
ncbi:MAG: PEP-utilizing enzyme [Patescibacteria group bacterium]